MHLFFAFADTLKHVGSEVVVLHFFNAVFYDFAKVEGLGAPSLRCEVVKPCLLYTSDAADE